MQDKPVTTTTLKVCPFCGNAATQNNWYPDECMCMNDKCIMFSRVVKHDVWNMRYTGDGKIEILHPALGPLEKGKMTLKEMLDD